MDWLAVTWQIVDEFLSLVKAPALVPDMWWIVIPLAVTILAMTFYFGKYANEKLGWNTALGNSIVLFFVGMDLLRTIYHYTNPPVWVNFPDHPIKSGAILLVMIEGVFLSTVAFKHSLPSKIMFFIASPLPVNLQAYVLSAVVYTRMTPTWHTLVAALLLFVILLGLLLALKEIQHLRFGHHKK